MCGIVGYVGRREAGPILVEGLRRLEYRGYDSAGIAVVTSGNKVEARKKRGKIDDGLARELALSTPSGTSGIGHTRWATHGPPTDENSHPHFDQSGHLALVHNGVIENYDRLKSGLVERGHRFLSATDTEVLAHWIGKQLAETVEAHRQPHGATTNPESPLPVALFSRAVAEALRGVIGTYGIAVICEYWPGVIIGARRGSPLILGVGDGENFIGSDASAIVSHTRQVVYLNDYDVVTLTPDRFMVENLGTETAQVQISRLEFDSEAAERGPYPHFMLKEIFEQAQTVRNALRGRIDHDDGSAKFGGLNMSLGELRSIDRIVIAACGTSWHAALVAEYLLEELAHIPTEVEYASEFRYRNAPMDKHALLLVITQSGETADTLA
ncbi:MAG TPA: glutamine--fructose-6-phosphate transaminase (isomerizing), partial [Candidatus Limnocylindria bacterium]|nr:glutamine--fructose-6-phosphate transaminase (isomerizing) [Candidatus Limnocylindria bacterium]